jgi:hypothetical protein
MTTSATLPLRRAHAVPVPSAQLTHRRDVVRWALAHGQQLSRDALAAVVDHHAALAGGGSLCPDGPALDLCWTVDDVAAALDLGDTWCDAVGAQPPVSLAATLTTYLRYLGSNGLLAPESARPRALREAVTNLAAPGGRERARHPSAMAPVQSLHDRH